jgi:copper chaperone
MKRTFKVVGMSCMHCQRAVQNALENNDMIHSVDVDLKSGEVQIECDDSLDMDMVVEIIENTGYKVK